MSLTTPAQAAVNEATIFQTLAFHAVCYHCQSMRDFEMGQCVLSTNIRVIRLVSSVCYF